jgi:hypothetical protein
MDTEIPGRRIATAALLTLYGVSCAVAFLGTTREMIVGLVFASAIAAPYVTAPLIMRVLKNSVIAALLYVLIIIFPVLILGAILFAAYTMHVKMKRFGYRMPFLMTCVAVCTFIAQFPHWVRNGMAAGSIGHGSEYLWAMGVGVAGILLLLAIMGLCAVFGVDPTTAAFYTMGYGWYLLVFILTFLMPDGEDGEGDGGDDEVDWEFRF